MYKQETIVYKRAARVLVYFALDRDGTAAGWR
jgi:hypothetical protein